MARPRKQIPDLYKMADGRYAANFAGVRVPYGRDEAEARRLYAADCAEWLQSGGAVAPRPAAKAGPARPSGPAVSVNEALLAYATFARDYYPPEGKQFERVMVALDVVGELYGSDPVTSFGPKALAAVRRHLLATRRRWKRKEPRPKKGARGKVIADAPPAKLPPFLARTYVNALVGCVQTAWGWLAAQELVPAANADALEKVTALRQGKGGEEVPAPAAVPDAVVEATLPFCNPVVAAMVRVQRLTGMRPGELCRMRPRDVSRSPAERLPVPGTRPVQMIAAVPVGDALVWAYLPATHKTMGKAKRRIIPIPPAAQAHLLPLLDGRDPDACVFSAREAADAVRERLGRAKRYGRGKQPRPHYDTRTYGQSVEYAIAAANLARLRLGPCRPEDLVPHWTPNLIRHAVATEADAGADRDTTAAVLGHSTPNMSATYAQTAFERAARYLAGLGSPGKPDA